MLLSDPTTEGAIDWTFTSPQSSHWKPNPQCDGIWSLWRWLGPEGGAPMMGWVPLWKRPQKAPCPFCQRRGPSMNQKAGSHQMPNLPVPWSQTFQAPEQWGINLCCLNHPVYGIFVIFVFSLNGLRHKGKCSVYTSLHYYDLIFVLQRWYTK